MLVEVRLLAALRDAEDLTFRLVSKRKTEVPTEFLVGEGEGSRLAQLHALDAGNGRRSPMGARSIPMTAGHALGRCCETASHRAWAS